MRKQPTEEQKAKAKERRERFRSMSKEINRNAPTWENQLWHARKLAMTGRICGCGSCFCCAALFVYNELNAKAGI